MIAFIAALNVGLMLIGGGVLLGVKVGTRTAGLPMSRDQYVGLVGMLHAADERQAEALRWYAAYLEKWEQGVLLESTGAFEVVTPTTYTTKELEPSQ